MLTFVNLQKNIKIQKLEKWLLAHFGCILAHCVVSGRNENGLCRPKKHTCSSLADFSHNAVVTPLRKAASYEPRIASLGIWGGTWLTRGKYGIYVAVRGSYGALKGSTWRLLPRKIIPIYCRVSYVAVTRIPSLVLRNTWHFVIIRYSYGELPKFVLRCSYEAALRKGVTTA